MAGILNGLGITIFYSGHHCDSDVERIAPDAEYPDVIGVLRCPTCKKIFQAQSARIKAYCGFSEMETIADIEIEHPA